MKYAFNSHYALWKSGLDLVIAFKESKKMGGLKQLDKSSSKRNKGKVLWSCEREVETYSGNWTCCLQRAVWFMLWALALDFFLAFGVEALPSGGFIRLLHTKWKLSLLETIQVRLKNIGRWCEHCSPFGTSLWRSKGSGILKTVWFAPLSCVYG